MVSLFFKAVEEGNEGEVARLLDEDPALLEKADHEGLTPFLLAAEHGQLGVMQLLIRRGADASATASTWGSTALHLAAWGGQAQAAAFLLGQGAQSTHREGDGRTPFMMACERRHLGVVRLFLQHLGKQELHATNEEGQTALHAAAWCGDEDIVTFLLGQGALPSSRDKTNVTPLMLACEEGQTGVVKLLLQHVGPQALQETDNEGKTALHHAALWGHEETVTFLLGQGAQANSKDKDGATPFMMACENGQTGHIDVVQVLLQHMGPQAFQETDEDGRTALHFAAYCGHEETVTFLLGQGAHANSRDEVGCTPFMMACMEGCLGAARMLLLEHVGSQALQETDEDGRTALHYAAIGGNEEAAAFLISQGAEANRRNARGSTPLMLACRGGRMGVVRLLLQHIGPQALQERNARGKVALHWACEKGHGEVVRALLLFGADPTVRDHKGRTPRAIAEMEEEEDEKGKGSRAGCVAAFEVRKSLSWPTPLSYGQPTSLHLDVLIQVAL
jgi:ankyrin repeat protein